MSINKERHIKYKGLYTLIIMLALSMISFLGYSQANEYVLQAVYLEKFSRFVTWPEESGMGDANKPFIILVIGQTPLKENLEQIYAIQKINGKKVEIKQINKKEEIQYGHILFIAESEKKNLNTILEITRQKPILTVSSSPEFGERGVLINFFEENKKLRFEINESEVLLSQLKMSFYLLNSAVIVKPINDNP
ncbi:MAG TPA: YfiR family protein [Bacteroidales bacterium]|nr:YfiR family protein [Bacteroidales bacterium]